MYIKIDFINQTRVLLPSILSLMSWMDSQLLVRNLSLFASHFFIHCIALIAYIEGFRKLICQQKKLSIKDKIFKIEFFPLCPLHHRKCSLSHYQLTICVIHESFLIPLFLLVFAHFELRVFVKMTTKFADFLHL